jgi:lysophospholipase L1-like esterase
MRRCGKVLILWLALAACVIPSLAVAADAKLRQGDYVAVIGDSITEQQLYSLYIEDYLLMCKPAAGLQVTQFGWGGETAPGFARRMANDMLRFHASAATTCFGMNDGGYSPLDPGKAQRYRVGQKSIVAQLKKGGVRLIVVGSPGCVDADTFRNSPQQAAMYNKTLAGMRDVARQVAQEEEVMFADVFEPMMETMTKAKAKYGRVYHLGGGDGVHPDRNGHLVMAYAFLKALGCDGNVGTITLSDGKAEVSEGHKVLSYEGGADRINVEIESSRYPFCFYGDPTQPNSTRGVLEFLPFNDELNRLKLVVTGLKGERLKVTWGQASKEFSADQLAKGINLAAEFLDNPFSAPFRKVEEKIAQQQGVEVPLVKSAIHGLPVYRELLPEETETLERLAEKLVKKDQQAREQSAAAVTPVKHTIRIEP